MSLCDIVESLPIQAVILRVAPQIALLQRAVGKLRVVQFVQCGERIDTRICGEICRPLRGMDEYHAGVTHAWVIGVM
jgi:hypothetical protein